MQSVTSATAVATTAVANDITLFASLELSKSKPDYALASASFACENIS